MIRRHGWKRGQSMFEYMLIFVAFILAAVYFVQKYGAPKAQERSDDLEKVMSKTNTEVKKALGVGTQ